MDEKQIINDIWDVLMKNKDYITQDEFFDKWVDCFVEVDNDEKAIRLTDGQNDYLLKIEKI